MEQANQPADLVRTVLQLIALAALIAASFWIFSPFLMALIWAGTIVIATWPVLLRLQDWFGGRRSLAVAVLTLALLLILVIPFYFGITAIVEGAQQIAEWSKSLGTFKLPALPAWVESLPIIGQRIAARWSQLAAAGSEELSARLSPYLQGLLVWFVAQVGGIGALLLQFLLTVINAAILYANGETVARGADLFARRLAGPQGVNAVHLAGQAVRGVALGVVVTAVLQSAAAGVGLVLIDVPFAPILIAVTFMLCVAQLGPGLVLFPAVIWFYTKTSVAWGTVFLIWAVFCGTFDNFLRPVLIRRGADLPLLLIFAGVIGGLIGFGIIGLFIGPVVLAVAYTLVVDWVSAGDAAKT